MRNAFGKITATLTIVERLFDPENERVTWGNVVTRMMDYKRDCPEYRITLHSKDRLRSITVSYERCRLRIEKRRPIFGPKFTVALKYFPIFTDFSPKKISFPRRRREAQCSSWKLFESITIQPLTEKFHLSHGS